MNTLCAKKDPHSVPPVATGTDRHTCIPVLIDPRADTPLRRYALEQLLRIIGLRADFQPRGEPFIHYGTPHSSTCEPAAIIPADDESCWQQQPPTMTEIESVAVLHHGPAPQRLHDARRLTFDIVRATAWWITLESEGRVQQRDIHGRVPAAASLLGRGGRLQRPPLHDYARLLMDLLARSGWSQEPRSHWPLNKRYAVALTHDVDNPERPAPWQMAWKEITSLRQTGLRRTYWAVRSHLLPHGVDKTFLSPPTHRREWDFDRYNELEQRCGLRSAFYFSVVHRREGCHPDVNYDAALPRYRRLMRRLERGGWEVGLHAAYTTYRGQPLLARQVRRLSRLSGQRPAGLRHHYLMLDPSCPLDTLAEHARAGLLYDTSIGFNDTPGFRAGTALPFQPYDPAGRSAAPLVELPMTLADMHLPRDDIPAAVRRVRDHLQTVRSLGGLAVLNWHVGHWDDAPAWREAYREACRLLSSDDEAWVATPREIALWWLNGA